MKASDDVTSLYRLPSWTQVLNLTSCICTTKRHEEEKEEEKAFYKLGVLQESDTTGTLRQHRHGVCT